MWETQSVFHISTLFYTAHIGIISTHPNEIQLVHGTVNSLVPSIVFRKFDPLGM
jgi:hypothetical protein